MELHQKELYQNSGHKCNQDSATYMTKSSHQDVESGWIPFHFRGPR